MYYSIKTKGRNIRGRFRTVAWGNSYVKGAISIELENAAVLQGNSSDPDWNSLDFFFEANAGNKADNPTAGHAIGPDIHPYSLYLVPLITY